MWTRIPGTTMNMRKGKYILLAFAISGNIEGKKSAAIAYHLTSASRSDIYHKGLSFNFRSAAVHSTTEHFGNKIPDTGRGYGMAPVANKGRPRNGAEHHGSEVITKGNHTGLQKTPPAGGAA